MNHSQDGYADAREQRSGLGQPVLSGNQEIGHKQQLVASRELSRPPAWISMVP
jgi:hypothetical protein